MGERIKKTLHIMTGGNVLKYACVRCEVLSECTKLIEEYLNSRRIHHTRLIDPEPYLLETVGESMYEGGSSLGWWS